MPNTDGLKRGGSKGRPKGTPNRTTVEVRELAQKLVTDPTCRVRRDLPSAIRAVDRAVEQLADYFHYAPDWETEHARIWVDDLPDGFEEPWPRPPGVGYAMHLLAWELTLRTRLQAVQQGKEWRLEERPTMFTLEAAIVWSIRSTSHVLHYRLCESCRKPFLAWRKDHDFATRTVGAVSESESSDANRRRRPGALPPVGEAPTDAAIDKPRERKR